MRFITFLRYQCYFYWLRWRWLSTIPVGLLLGYWACQVLRVLNWQTTFNEGVSSAPGGNALEAFIWAFGKPEIVYFVATALFVYLVSDFLPESAYEQRLITRLGKHSSWWFAKVFLVFFSTLLFAALLFGSFFLVVLQRYPLSAAWSPSGLNNFGMGLGFAVKNGTPVQGALSISTFLLLGWFAIGLLMLTINQLTRRSWAGFLCGALLIVTANLGAITGGSIGGEGWLSYLLIQNHLEYTPLWSPMRIIPESGSCIFWTVWILICIVIGWISSERTDILAIEP